MLKITENINVAGSSEIEGTQALYMAANISTDNQTSSITKTITNQELYQRNKDACRKDSKEFEEYVYSIEDEIKNKGEK